MLILGNKALICSIFHAAFTANAAEMLTMRSERARLRPSEMTPRQILLK